MTRLASTVVRLAMALLSRLGVALRPIAASGPLMPAVVPLDAHGAHWLPLRPLGLPDEYTPMTGGEP